MVTFGEVMGLFEAGDYFLRESDRAYGQYESAEVSIPNYLLYEIRELVLVDGRLLP